MSKDDAGYPQEVDKVFSTGDRESKVQWLWARSTQACLNFESFD